nr:immunoglobulin-like domain-containing protein [Maliibacterium massiliense]
MKTMGKFCALLLSTLLLLTLSAPGAFAAPGDVTVTLRVELDATTVAAPTSVTVPAGKTFADYGLAGLTDPGYVTPLHALAQYMLDAGYASTDTMGDCIDASQGQWGAYLNAILPGLGFANGGYTGLVSNNANNVALMFTVNDAFADLGVGSQQLQTGDRVAIFSVGSAYPAAPPYYTHFASETYVGLVGQPITVTLLGRNGYAYPAQSVSSPIAGAQITRADALGSADTETFSATDASGQAALTLDAPTDAAGIQISAIRRQYGTPDFIDISRPYANVKVYTTTAGHEAAFVAADADSLLLAATAKENLTLPAHGASGATSITWQSSNAALIAADGTVHRPAVGQPDGEATLTATISLNGQSQQKHFKVAVPAYSTALRDIGYAESGISFAPDTLDYDVYVPDGTSTVILTPKAAEDSAVIDAVGASRVGQTNNFMLSMGQESHQVQLRVSVGGASRTYTLRMHRYGGLPDYAASWPSLRGNAQNMGLTGAATARSAAETELLWATKLGQAYQPEATSAIGAPILVDDALYIAAGNQLYKLDKQGAQLSRATLASDIGYFANIAYGGGMIFVPVSDGRIQAFNAATLAPLWISPAQAGHQINTSILYHEGYVYAGTFAGTAYTSLDGVFFCIKAEDADALHAMEENPYVWQYRAGGARKGFYWSGGAVAGGALLFGSDEGKLISHALVDDAVIDAIDVGSDIRCATAFDVQRSRAYFTTKDGALHSVKVNADGTFDRTSLRSRQMADESESTSTPVVYNGRVYASTGSVMSDGAFHVLDADTLAEIYRVDLGGITQSAPLLSTAYATDENDQKVYLYVALNEASGSVVRVEDSAHNTTPRVETLYTPAAGMRQYSTASLIADASGALYYTNNAGYLVALGSRDIHVTGIAFAQEAVTMAVGETKDVQPAFTPQDAPDKQLLWQSSDPARATVDAQGVVRALAPGAVTITARALDAASGSTSQASYTVTISQASVPTPAPSTEPAPQGGAQQGSQGSPGTGDNLWPVWLLAGLLALSAVGIVAFILYRKRGKSV